MFENLRRDIRFALRRLSKSPGFAAAAILTLALGIGATTAMFSVINGVMLRPLPYRDPDRLVMVLEHVERVSQEPLGLPPGDVLTFQREGRAFDGVAGFQSRLVEITGAGNPQQVEGIRSSSSLFTVLGVSPAMGRTFTEEEDWNRARVVIISHSFAQRAFGGGTQALGRIIDIDRVPFAIIGVMPPEFRFPLEEDRQAPQDVWVPMAFTDQERAQTGTNFNFGAVARLKPGVSLAQAEADAERLGRQIEASHSASIRANLKLDALVQSFADYTYGSYRAPLLLLLLAVGCLLLIAVSNVANLMLAKASARQQEMAIRLALGARGRRLGAQLVTEGIVLSVVGGALGVLIATFGTRALIGLVPSNVPRLQTAGADIRVLLFALAVSVLSGIVFGLAPALFAMRADVNSNLKTRGASLGRRHSILRTGFAALQVALALVLLIGCGLLIRSFQRTMSVDPGFRPENMLTAELVLPKGQYQTPQQIRNFFTEVVRRLQATAGTNSAGGSTDLPLQGSWNTLVTVEGQPPPPVMAWNSCLVGDYFQAAGIPIIHGRPFAESDDQTAPRVIIISQKLAKRAFGDRDPIGQRIKFGVAGSQRPWMTVVGVAGDVKQRGLDVETTPQVYIPFVQLEDNLISLYPLNFLNLAMRSQAPPEAAAAQLRQAVSSLDRELPVTRLQSMAQLVSQSIAPRRFYMVLVMIFAAAAMLLATVGLYGVIACSVTQRTRELGVRMTLGASRADVVRLVLRWGALIALAGIVGGIAGALALTRAIRSFLYGVQPTDPLTFLTVVLILATVTLAACYIPARRAAAIDPTIALRYE